RCHVLYTKVAILMRYTREIYVLCRSENFQFSATIHFTFYMLSRMLKFLAICVDKKATNLKYLFY
ncbi:MAG: hypothetical protein LBU04_06170, partial [Christensenellaceae bacterium]|nr:hypothetical protein [Christensenellaceae bacterium]